MSEVHIPAAADSGFSSLDAACERLFRLTGARTHTELAACMGWQTDALEQGSLPDALLWLRKLIVTYRVFPAWIIYGTAPQRIPDTVLLDESTVDKILEEFLGVSLLVQ